MVLAEERAKGDADDHVVQDEPYAIMEPAQREEVSLPSHLASATANQYGERSAHLMYFEIDVTVRVSSWYT